LKKAGCHYCIEVKMTWPPTYLSPVSETELANSRGHEVVDFIETLCHLTEDSVAGKTGENFILRPWQKDMLVHLYAEKEDGSLKHRRALIGVSRKNGKSALIASLVLEQLVLGVGGGQIYSAAADKEQARIIFKTVKKMIELEPELREILEVYQNSIYNPLTGSVYRALSSEAYTKEGLNSTFIVIDELHAQPNRELYDVLSLSMGSREEPMLVAITTAGSKYDSTGKESLCYQMYQRGIQISKSEVEDASFFFAWYEADPKLHYKDEDNWLIANPSLNDILSVDDMRSASLLTPEAEFKTKRLNMWVSNTESWIPTDLWDSLVLKNRKIIPGEDCIIGFDGSFSGDTTAIVGWFMGGEKPHIRVLGVWELPEVDPDPMWHVNVAEVEQTIIDSCRNMGVNVLEVVFDPSRWQRTMMILEEEGLPIISYPNTAERMVPATQRFYEAVANQSFTHDGDEVLNRHIANCVTKTSSRGIMVSKSTNKKKIDAAVAAIFSFDRAMAPKPKKPIARIHFV
jgi:phage terminase large subunit-like protein